MIYGADFLLSQLAHVSILKNRNLPDLFVGAVRLE